MHARPATPEDADEIVRLAAVMFDSMGLDTTDPDWQNAGRRSVRDRLGADMAAFVVDHPEMAGRVAASAAGTISLRLASPSNPSARAGYVQWVCTDPGLRGRGLARLTMGSLLDWFDQHGVRSVELHATPMAEALYRALGFDDSGPRALRRRR